MARERRFTSFRLTGKLTPEGKHVGFSPSTKADAKMFKKLGLIAKQVGAESPPRKWLTVAETAQAIDLSEKTIRRAITRGELPASKVRSRIRIALSDLEAWLRDNRRRLGPSRGTSGHSSYPPSPYAVKMESPLARRRQAALEDLRP